jgi:outer membrane receptor protein involved in Fe transport
VGSEVVSRFGLEAVASRRTFAAAGNVVTSESVPAIEDASQTDAAVFASFDRALAGHASLSVGLRGDRVETENKGGFFGDRSTSHSALSGHAAVTVGPFADVTTTFQVARGFRDPFLSDRYFRGPSGRGFVIGNPDLEPERSLQFDASARWTSKGRSVALFAYHYQIDDLVERFRPANDFFFRNRGEATVEGIELEAQADLGHGLSLELAAAVARGEAEDGAPVDDIAAPNATSTLRWAGERGFAFARGLVVLEDDEPGPIEVERPGHTVFDVGGGFRITPKLEIRALARNLTDRRYRDSADEVASLARGQSFSLGLVGKY